MTSPFDGAHAWLWNLANCDAGSYDAIAQRVLGSGGRGVFVKASDGGAWFPQQQAGSNRIVPVTEIVTELRSRGLVVCTWSYNYGSDIPGEAQRTIETITEAKPDGHIFDIEAEFETLPDAAARATQLLQTVQAGIPPGFPLAYAPLPSIRNHLRLPYRQFTDAGCVLVPETYFNALGWTPDRTLSEFYADAEWYQLLSQPVAPAYGDFLDKGVTRPTNAGVAAFTALLAARGAPGISVWSYEHLDADGWDRFAAAAQAFQVVTPPQPKPQPTNDDLIAMERCLLATPPDIAGLIAYAGRFV